MLPSARLSVRLTAALFAIAVVSGSMGAEVSFVRDLVPVIVKRCTSCHGDRKDSGSLRLHTFENLMRGGASGDPSIVAGQPEKSELFKLITATDENDRMPRDDDALTAAQVELFRN